MATDEPPPGVWTEQDLYVTQRRADRLLWKLWITTGMPPLIEHTDESLHAFLLRNDSAYRQYVTEHKDLTLENLQRLGLTNAIDAFGSPLWYMTIKYLTEKTCLSTTWNIWIDTVPYRFMVVTPLTEQDYRRQSAALSDWLKANEGRMIWDPKAKRFCPKSGAYVGTDDLMMSTFSDDLRDRMKEELRGKEQRDTGEHP